MYLDPVNWFAVFARVGAVLMVFPLTGSTNVPVRLRVALAALAAFLLGPLLPASGAGHGAFWGLVGLIFKEVCTGLVLGFVARLVFFGLELAAGILATEMGLMLSPQFNPLNQSQVTAPGMMLHWLALMLFLGLDLHHWLLAALQRSYALAPAGAAGLGEAALLDILGGTSRLFVFALQIVAPVLAVSFTISLIFSVLARAVPQMNVFAESFPVRTLTTLMVFGLCLNLMAQHLLNQLRRLPDDLLRAARLLGAG
ncbi:MAG: flagellar biosynthetic protein FliR [Verrucomicrobiota bacterium]